MPRRPRLHLADYPHHLVQRGHNRAACFFADEDYQAYRHWLGEALEKTGTRLHAYVLMTNHVHLLLTPKAPEDLPRLIIALGRRFVQYINRTYRRTGTRWDSRYKSSPIQTDTDLLCCQRYIELNPVRAEMVRAPGVYPWSRVLAALAQSGRWVKIYYGWRPNLPDEADNHLIELALAGGAVGIVTHNVRDLGRGELVFEQPRLLTPAQCLEEWL